MDPLLCGASRKEVGDCSSQPHLGTSCIANTPCTGPSLVFPRAHGIDPALAISEASAERDPDPIVIPPPQPRWITALRTLPYSDLFVSGSWDGHVRVWKLSEDKKKFAPLGVLGSESRLQEAAGVNGNHAEDGDTQGAPKVVSGIVNDIAVFERGDRGRDGLCLVVATGKEIRLGRWKVCKGVNAAPLSSKCLVLSRQRQMG